MRSHLTCKSVSVPMSFIYNCALHLLVLHDIRCETQSMPCPCTLYCSLAKIKIVSHPWPAPHLTGSPSDSKSVGEPDSSLELFTTQDQEDIWFKMMPLTILRIGILENDDWLVSGFLLTSYRQSHQTGVIALVGRELCGDWAEQPLHIASNSFFVESTLTFPKKWDRMKFTRSGWPAEKSTKLRRYIPEEASVKSTQQESTFSES